MEEEQEEEEDAQKKDSIEARIAGAVTLVAAEFSVTPAEIKEMISAEEGYLYAEENDLDLVETLRTGYARAVSLMKMLKKFSQEYSIDMDRLKNLTDWYDIIDNARSEFADSEKAMRSYLVSYLNSQQKSSSQAAPMPSKIRAQEEDRLSVFKCHPSKEAKKMREEMQKRLQSEKREKKLKQARAKMDAAVSEQLGEGDASAEDDVSVTDMMMKNTV